jgi:hypothetical protein
LHPALLSLAIRQDCCEKSPCLRAKNPAIQRTLLIKTTSDNKKGSFAQQLRKAAQTVGIDSPAIPALWCSTRFRQQRYGLYAVKIAQCRGVCQGKTAPNILRSTACCGILIMVYYENLESRNPFYAAKP